VIAWLEASALAVWARESPSIWAYPTILMLHTVGLGVIVGASAVVDVRMLGYAPRIALRSLAPLFRLIWLASALSAATGGILFIADATTKSTQPVFYVKLTLIALALWTTVGAKRAVVRDEPKRWIALLSLLLWAGAITAGRLMAYL
jgi:hypothetical protein